MKGLRGNNKGFSLVELIVVVLIIGILGVTLAPNIMKWVNNARTNSDEKNRASLESSVSAAVADFLSTPGNKIEGEFKFVLKGARPSEFTNDGEDEWQKNLIICIENVLNGKYPKTQDVNYGYEVTISELGEVKVIIKTS